MNSVGRWLLTDAAIAVARAGIPRVTCVLLFFFHRDSLFFSLFFFSSLHRPCSSANRHVSGCLWKAPASEEQIYYIFCRENLCISRAGHIGPQRADFPGTLTSSTERHSNGDSDSRKYMQQRKWLQFWVNVLLLHWHGTSSARRSLEQTTNRASQQSRELTCARMRSGFRV